MINVSLAAIACLTMPTAQPTGAGAEPPALKAALQVELVPFIREHSRAVIVRFRNTGDEPITVLRPLDGSQWGWYLPTYRFRVIDDAGRQLPLPARCGVSGVWHETSWPDDYVVPVPSGSTAVVRVDVPFEVESGRDYTLQLEYITTPDATTGARAHDLALPAEAWVGSGASEATRIRWIDSDPAHIGAIDRPRYFQTGDLRPDPDAIRHAQARGLAVLGTLFELPIDGRDQPALERAQLVMLQWDARGYRLESVRDVIGEPTSVRPGMAEWVFESGLGWRFIAQDGVVTAVEPVGPP